MVKVEEGSRGRCTYPNNKKWDFTTSYPVIRISFGTGFIGKIETFDKHLKWVLEEVEKDLAISFDKTQDAKACFRELIWKAREKYGQEVVILIDEYDKPILVCCMLT